MITPPKSAPAPELKRLSIQSWGKGYVSAFDVGRMPHSGLVRMTNARLRQNGTVGPRPGLARYGDALPGKVLGFEELVSVEGNVRTTKLIAIVEDGASASVYVAADGRGWQKKTGAVFQKGAYPTFLQVGHKVVISNGEDYVSYYDIKTDKVVRPEALLDVTGVKATATGLHGEGETIYYAVTAVRNGETARSVTASVKVSKGRSEWRGRTTKPGEAEEYVKVTWNKVNGAELYGIYAGISPTSLRLMKFVAHESGGGTTQSHDDTGHTVLNPNVTPPDGNSTAGIKAARAELIAGRVYLLGDKTDPWKISFGGADPDTMLNFSAFTGGFIRINAGSKQIPVAMKAFRNGRGDAVPMVLCSETNGNGSLKYLQMANMQLDATNLQWISVIDDNGRDGTDSPNAVVIYNNSLVYPSRTGFKTTRTKMQMQNVLATDVLTDAIQPDIERLNNNFIHKAIGIEMQGVLYFALPVGASTLNQIWTLDMKRGMAWCMPWIVGEVADMKVYGGSDGKSRLLIAQDDKLMALSEEVKHTDDGTPFLTDIGSGMIKFSEDGALWTSVDSITFILLRPTGRVRFAISAKTEDEPAQELLSFTKDFTQRTVPEGWNSPHGWDSELGWGLPEGVQQEVKGEVRVPITKDIDEDVNWLQYSVSSDEAGADYELSDVIVQHDPIGVLFEEDEDDE